MVEASGHLGRNRLPERGFTRNSVDRGKTATVSGGRRPPPFS